MAHTTYEFGNHDHDWGTHPLDFLWKAITLYFASIILLRISGRKSISQMTIGTTVVMLSIGAIIVEPVVNKGVLQTVVTIAVFVGLLVLIEYLQMKFRWLQDVLVGKPVIVIQEGVLVEENLKRLRLTKEKIAMRLRKLGIDKTSDVKLATLEANGDIGYELMPGAKPLTVEAFRKLMGLDTPGHEATERSSSTSAGNLFARVERDAE